jgi:cellulose synthase/poly-beta-1,6-N-acetylglucosamine synthase-like glycosyltransferase
MNGSRNRSWIFKVVGNVTAVRMEKFDPDYAAVVEARVWPRITLVTAVYNGARYIEDTIRSIVSQEYPNLEYIVVDGASTDGTVELIRKNEKN